MKYLILTFALIAGFNSYASTLDGYTLPISGQESEENFILNAIQTKIEHRQEVITKTCSRTVLVRNDKSCNLELVPRCWYGHDRARICKNELEVVCRETPQYRQEYYTCYETLSIPHEVFSYNSKAIVNVKLPNVPEGASLPLERCNINFKLDGGSFTPTANCYEFMVLAKKSASESREGQTVTQDHKLDISLVNLKDIIAPIKGGISEMRVEGQNLVFRTGDLTRNKNISLKLFVENKKLLGDKTLIERQLAPSEYSFEKISDDYGIVKIDLTKLIGGINTKKKHYISVEINVLIDTHNSINQSLPSFNAFGSMTVKN